MKYTAPAQSDALEKSGAQVIDQLVGVGVGFTLMIICVAISLFANYLQFKRNCSLVDQMFSIIPQATASMLKAVDDFREIFNANNEKN